MQGGLMAARVFDTYMPGSVEPLVSFINSLSDGRILCLSILVSDDCTKQEMEISQLRSSLSFDHLTGHSQLFNVQYTENNESW